MKCIDQIIAERYSIYHADTVEVARALPDSSIHFSVFSPPFSSLYTYSASPRDFGNSRDDGEFWQQYRYLIAETYRAMMPGRLVAIHCMDLPTSKTVHGYIGLRDFPGDIIRAYEEAGFIYHSRITIWKDPVQSMQRTKALGLLHKQIKKDSAMSRQGIADTVVVMRKPDENPEPIAHTDDTFPVTMWQRYASPVWATVDGVDDERFHIITQDVNPSDTLQYRSAREEEDERHICLAEGSLVLTREHGYMPIESVSVGDRVLTHKGRWMPVLGKQCNGEADTVRVSGHGVPGLVCTPDHKLWARRGIGRRAKEIALASSPEWTDAAMTLGSYLNLPTPPEEGSALTDHEWWIVGRWLGDGHAAGHRRSGARNGRGQFIVSCNHNEADALIERLGCHVGHVTKRTATQIALINLRDPVRDVLSRCGRGAPNKRLPGEAVCLSRAASEALLSGYLSADGHYVPRHDRWMASSVSKTLLLGIAIVAQRARGVVASVYPGRGPRAGMIQGRSVNMRQDWILSFRNSDGHRKSGWIDESGSWKKVRKIECAPKATVWDLKVASDESFVAEGCVVHNCPLQLPVIRRCIQLWSNPMDIVWSPFMGIGSEGVVALEEGRRFIGAELKSSYLKQSAANIAAAVSESKKQMSLFG